MKTNGKTYDLPLNPEDAPPGTYASPQENPKKQCQGCFYESPDPCPPSRHCCASEREDRQPCIFLKK